MSLADVIVHTSQLALWLAFMTPFAAWIVWAVLATCRNKYGDYPRGTRTLIHAATRPARALKRAAMRVFYGDQARTHRDPRQPAYDAVYAYIERLGDHMPPDPVHRNALIWRSVHAALDTLDNRDTRDA